jgi:hypothetical protein
MKKMATMQKLRRERGRVLVLRTAVGGFDKGAGGGWQGNGRATGKRNANLPIEEQAQLRLLFPAPRRWGSVLVQAARELAMLAMLA